MTRTVKKPAERRAEIIQAARHLFQTKKYDSTTMQDVMERLGIAKGTIYHYFLSKEALLEAVIEDMVDTNLKLMEVRVQKTKGNALKKMWVLIEAGNMSEGHENILEGLHKASNSVMHTRILAATLIKQAPLYASVIQQGCDEGIFQISSSALECAEFILAGFQFLIDRGIYPWMAEDLKRRVEAFPRLIEDQLKAPKGSFQFLAKMMQPTMKGR